MGNANHVVAGVDIKNFPGDPHRQIGKEIKARMANVLEADIAL